jgi:phage shock protein PspC (stress-responsive transcriptional regulator)
MANNNIRRLYRSKTNRIIFGVCGGLGEYFEVDPIIVRLIFVLFTITGGVGLILYFAMALIIPSEEGTKKASIGEEVQGLAREARKSAWIRNSRNIFGLIIVLVGLNILFEQVFDIDFFRWINWGIFWAVLIIALGMRLIFNNKD